MITFNAIDVETANPNQRSICQIGICTVKDGVIEEKWATLINPEEPFSQYIVEKIHGIEERYVKNAPTLPDIQNQLFRRLDDSVLVSHSKFDQNAIQQAYEKYSLNMFSATWLDSIEIAKKTWPNQLPNWQLSSIASHLGLSLFRPHDALEDATVVAEITLEACKQKRWNIKDLM